jgi:hypothetical protein
MRAQIVCGKERRTFNIQLRTSNELLSDARFGVES